MDFLNQTFLLLRKDLLGDAPARKSVDDVFFGTLLLFVFHFSFRSHTRTGGGDGAGSPLVGVSFHWHIGLAQLFEAERSNHCLDAVAFAYRSRRLFLAKTAFNFILMVLVEIVVIPLFWILFVFRSWDVIPNLFLVTLLGTWVSAS